MSVLIPTIFWVLTKYCPPFIITHEARIELLWYENDLSLNMIKNSSVIRQKGESKNGCFMKTKHAKFSEKRTFLTP